MMRRSGREMDPVSPGDPEEERLDRLLCEAVVEVRPDLGAAVMARVAALPESARPVPALALGRADRRSWTIAAAGALALVLVAAGLAAWAAGGAQGSAFSLVATLGDFFATSVLTGAGLLVASWRGAGLALRQAAGGSVVSLAALAVVTVALNYFLVRAWRSGSLAGSSGPATARAAAPTRRREK